MSDGCNYFVFSDPGDSFQSWMGLRGPAGPAGAPGPQGPPGTGLHITDTVATVEDLPETAPQGTMYNVGTAAPYTIYMYQTGQGWLSQGQLEGPPGPAGPAGPAGADGAPGTPGAAATIAVGSVSGLPAGSTPTVTNSGSSSAAVLNFGIPAGATGATGPQGPQGEPGRGLTISGTVATTAQLPATAEQGTFYNVGTSAPYNLYMYQTGQGWIDQGQLQGPAGPQGEPGTPGAAGSDGTTFTPSVSAAGVISWTNDGGKQNPPSVNIKGPQGATGPAGQDGSDGVSPEVTITSITGGHTVTITDADHPTGQSFDVMDGTDGQDGSDGAAAGFGTPTVSVGSGTGTPSASVSASGPDTAKIFAFTFNNLKGEPGDAAVKKGSVTISSSSWSGSGPYTQTVTISGATITANTKVDLQPDATVLAQMISDGVTALYIENNNGTLTAYAIGAATSANITVQATWYETT